MIIAYIRVSTNKQDIENQKHTILEYANKRKIFIDEFINIKISSRKSIEERKLNNLIDNLNKDDTLIITELSRLGRSVSEVTSLINQLIEKEIRLISIKEAIDTVNKHDINSKVVITMFSLLAELERDLISQRTKEALATKKAQGVKLGRPTGKGTSKLDKHTDDIKNMLSKGITISSVAKYYNCSWNTAKNFIKSRNIL
ncbi:MAG: recombinase family protein [bacterium]